MMAAPENHKHQQCSIEAAVQDSRERFQCFQSSLGKCDEWVSVLLFL